MIGDDAERIGRRIVNTWRLTPPLSEWIDALRALEVGQATAAFMRARDEVDGAMSIARFGGYYRAVGRATVTPPTPRQHAEVVSPTDQRASAAFARGYTQGKADRQHFALCRCEWCRTHSP